MGSTRTGRFGPTVANRFVEHAEQRAGITVDVIDLAESPLPERRPVTPPPRSRPIKPFFGRALEVARSEHPYAA
ncbi:NADPH-dependent FMN reductase [Nocardia africana]|uniref:NADPH-dependent FMN reductase n=1 Tax=Nocardia africana TaxID=134964 RepID=UPI001C3F8F8D|nr:NAD(P)H-dependent oxidoreductase [Nocardia africana]